MKLNMVQPKNIFETLKRKIPQNILNIKQVYNVRAQNNEVIRGQRTEIQQLLNLLDDNHYVSRYKVCEDGEIVRDTFWTHHDSIKLFNIFSNVIFINSTYRTNKYRLRLLKRVLVTRG